MEGRLSKLECKLDLVLLILTDLQKSTNKMDEHIDFVESISSMLQPFHASKRDVTHELDP